MGWSGMGWSMTRMSPLTLLSSVCIGDAATDARPELGGQERDFEFGERAAQVTRAQVE